MILSFLVAIDPFLIMASLPFIGRMVQLWMVMSASSKDFTLMIEVYCFSFGVLFC